MPLQVPPHDEPSLAQAWRTPWGAPLTAVQVPSLPVTSQASHCPSQAVLQQSPSTQLPLAHWLFDVQRPGPLAFWGTQVPAAQ